MLSVTAALLASHFLGLGVTMGTMPPTPVISPPVLFEQQKIYPLVKVGIFRPRSNQEHYKAPSIKAYLTRRIITRMTKPRLVTKRVFFAGLGYVKVTTRG